MNTKYKIPNSWKLKTFDEALEVLKDGTHFSPQFFGGKNIYITSKNIRMGRLDLEDIIYIPDEEHKRIYSASPVKAGDVLLTKDGASTGNVCINTLEEEFSLLSSVAYLRGKAGLLENEYLLQWLSSPRVQFDIKKDMAGQAITRLTLQKISKFKILLPPLSEQKAIADLLSTWDKAIKKIKQLIQAKESELRQISNLFVFGYKRINNKESKLADGNFFKYASDWDLIKIGKIAEEIITRNGDTEETVLSCTKYGGFVNSLDYFGKQVFSSDTSNYKVIKKSQSGYPSNHVEEGSIGLLEHCEKGIVSPIYVVFGVNEKKVYPQYLYKLLKTDVYRHIFQVSTSSSVDRRGSLRWGDFSKMKVPLPPLEEQIQITEYINAYEKEIGLLKKIVEKYKAQKQGLMQKLLTGQWRIKPEVIKKGENNA